MNNIGFNGKLAPYFTTSGIKDEDLNFIKFIKLKILYKNTDWAIVHGEQKQPKTALIFKNNNTYLYCRSCEAFIVSKLWIENSEADHCPKCNKEIPEEIITIFLFMNL